MFRFSCRLIPLVYIPPERVFQAMKNQEREQFLPIKWPLTAEEQYVKGSLRIEFVFYDSNRY